MKPTLFRSAFTFLFILAVLVPAAWAQETPTPQATATPNAASQAFAEGNNAFGMDLFHRLGKSVSNDKNLVFSPYSISTALAMVWLGARNNTQAQMTQVLHLAGDAKTVGETYRQLRNSLEASGKDGGFDLEIANSLWIQKNKKFLQPFLDGLGTDFNAPPSLVDFSKPEPVRQQINRWVEGKTRQKIKNLIGPGSLNSETKAVLVNAVYFKADWLNAFKPENTQSLPFHLDAGHSVSVPMMQMKANLRFTENDQVQVLELPYKGRNLSMVVLLPKDPQGLPTLESNLNSWLLDAWLSQMRYQEVQVKLPKFKFTYGTVELNPFLAEMGMPQAFGDGADFSGMTGKSDFVISRVLHKAFVNVDEKGTEAAAATAVGIKLTSLRRTETFFFNADHPFLFLIWDNQTHSILFIGRVADPRAEE